MTTVLPFLGNTELEVLSVVGAFLLLLTHCAMAYCVKEKVVVDSGCEPLVLSLCVLLILRFQPTVREWISKGNQRALDELAYIAPCNPPNCAYFASRGDVQL